MTIRDGCAFCDGCPFHPVFVSVSDTSFARWERIPMQQGADAHLCPECGAKAARGWLAHDVVVECDGCGRNSVEHPEIERWFAVVQHDVAAPLNLCADCHAAR
ncbi:hypothetical protein FSW04_15360 [Baekduia soli]|uniref:Uncharacterized protein n=1 Tax=Baekduia soli TaxID=496014 RepID=A0A5B8U798_9ACTN|nr:hypothetical protein [Baekduia soli]QEC48817.1 hypothetical protein FSW04_15360 [Baekduia soli]